MSLLSARSAMEGAHAYVDGALVSTLQQHSTQHEALGVLYHHQFRPHRHQIRTTASGAAVKSSAGAYVRIVSNYCCCKAHGRGELLDKWRSVAFVSHDRFSCATGQQPSVVTCMSLGTAETAVA